MAPAHLVVFLLVCVSVSGLVVNGLVFVVFHRKSSLRTLSNRFVLSLVFANVLSTMLLIPGYIYTIVLPSISTAWSHILQGLTTFISLVSTLSTVLISLDRYYAVSSPLHYSTIVTRRKSLFMIALVWIVSLVLSLPFWFNTSAFVQSISDHSLRQVLDFSYRVFIFVSGFLAPFSALSWLYFRMYEAALGNNARTRRQSLSSGAAAEVMVLYDGSETLQLPNLAERLTKSSTNQRKSKFFRLLRIPSRIVAISLSPEGRPLRTSATIVLSFFACWFPYYLSFVVDYGPVWLCSAKLASFSSTLVSPAIYVYRNQVAREEAFRLLRSKLCPLYRPRTGSVSITLHYSNTYCRTNSPLAYSRRTSMISSNFESVRKGSNDSHLIDSLFIGSNPKAISPRPSVVKWENDASARCKLVPNTAKIHRTTSENVLHFPRDPLNGSSSTRLQFSKSTNNLATL